MLYLDKKYLCPLIKFLLNNSVLRADNSFTQTNTHLGTISNFRCFSFSFLSIVFCFFVKIQGGESTICLDMFGWREGVDAPLGSETLFPISG